MSPHVMYFSLGSVPQYGIDYPSQAWGLPFKGSPMFTLTSMVMPSIIMQVIHIYISIAMKLL